MPPPLPLAADGSGLKPSLPALPQAPPPLPQAAKLSLPELYSMAAQAVARVRAVGSSSRWAWLLDHEVAEAGVIDIGQPGGKQVLVLKAPGGSQASGSFFAAKRTDSEGTARVALANAALQGKACHWAPDAVAGGWWVCTPLPGIDCLRLMHRCGGHGVCMQAEGQWRNDGGATGSRLVCAPRLHQYLFAHTQTHTAVPCRHVRAALLENAAPKQYAPPLGMLAQIAALLDQLRAQGRAACDAGLENFAEDLGRSFLDGGHPLARLYVAGDTPFGQRCARWPGDSR